MHSNFWIIKKSYKHIISVILFTAILLPFAVQFVHSFEKHEHSVCHEQNKIHFDTHEIDCSVFHFKINNNSIYFSSKVLKNKIAINEEKIVTVENQISSVKIQNKTSRAPPNLLM